jgi:hypothetical protein
VHTLPAFTPLSAVISLGAGPSFNYFPARTTPQVTSSAAVLACTAFRLCTRPIHVQRAWTTRHPQASQHPSGLFPLHRPPLGHRKHSPQVHLGHGHGAGSFKSSTRPRPRPSPRRPPSAAQPLRPRPSLTHGFRATASRHDCTVTAPTPLIRFRARLPGHGLRARLLSHGVRASASRHGVVKRAILIYKREARRSSSARYRALPLHHPTYIMFHMNYTRSFVA